MHLRVAIQIVLALAVLLAFEGTVKRIKDGDTLVVANGSGNTIVCRLYAIDAPEKAQPFGAEATGALKHILDGVTFRVNLTGDTSYGRQICVIEKEGTNVNVAIVRLGMAWVSRPYLKTPDDKLLYLGAEGEARQDRRGLWEQAGPIPPWEYRRGKRATPATFR
jgi:endonuclease YncB( thermonuclease family)